MLNRVYNLGKIFGIPIRAESSVFLLVLYVFLVYGGPFGGRLFFAFGLLASILWHELAHSLVAIGFGGKVRDITLQLLGGCATISQMPRRAWQEWIMALAGPASSVVLGILLFVVLSFIPRVLFLPTGFLVKNDWHAAVEYLAATNFGLAVFNLLPAFPMDGGRMLRSFLQSSMSKVKATWIASRIGRGIAIIFIISGIVNLMGMQLRIPATHWALVDLFLWFLFTGGGFLKVMIGFMIYQAAEMEYRMVLAEEAGQRSRRGFGFDPYMGNSKTTDWSVPPDDDRAVVSPPPYRKKPDHVDIKRGE